MVQCKDIPTILILKFIALHGGIGCNWYDTAEFDNPRSVRHAMPANIPDQLVHAKMRKLISNGYVDGCGCGCRGDFKLTKKGIQMVVDCDYVL